MSKTSNYSSSNSSSATAEAHVVAFRVEGNLLSTNAAGVRQHLEELLARPQTQAGSMETLELDLRSAQMVDSVGLNLLVWLIKTVRQRNARVRLLIGSVHVDRTLRFTRLDQHAEIVFKG